MKYLFYVAKKLKNVEMRSSEVLGVQINVTVEIEESPIDIAESC